MHLPYKEGTWFAVPLRGGGYAAGVVTRLVPTQGKIVLAYFFAPKRDFVPQLSDVADLTSRSAIKIARVGDLGIIDGSWPIIGELPRWNRDDWPMPTFIRKDDLSNTAWRVQYSDSNPNQVISERLIPFDSSEYEKDSLLGAGAAEIIISRMLN